jgi:single-stranded DNA-binding protein
MNINVVVLSGTIGNAKLFQIGERKVWEISLGVNKNGGETSWIPVKFWCGQNYKLEFRKGMQVNVSGSIETNVFTPKGSDEKAKLVYVEAEEIQVTNWGKSTETIEEAA